MDDLSKFEARLADLLTEAGCTKCSPAEIRNRLKRQVEVRCDTWHSMGGHGTPSGSYASLLFDEDRAILVKVNCELAVYISGPDCADLIARQKSLYTPDVKEFKKSSDLYQDVCREIKAQLLRDSKPAITLSKQSTAQWLV